MPDGWEGADYHPNSAFASRRFPAQSFVECSISRYRVVVTHHVSVAQRVIQYRIQCCWAICRACRAQSLCYCPAMARVVLSHLRVPERCPAPQAGSLVRRGRWLWNTALECGSSRSMRGCGNGTQARQLRHHRTKGAETVSIEPTVTASHPYSTRQVWTPSCAP
jgi:hypothetical protein